MELGGQHGLFSSVSTLGEPFTDDRFRRTGTAGSAVHVRGVDHIDAELKATVEQQLALISRCRPANIHGSQNQARNFQATTA
ncbi:unannotated protein [freshwater metagenome]|uniref:Unannotated protein n=1 Tax=freshwater metagenome TaxID=449393 RepID=A0A6J6VR42_9ZZZZ